MNNLKLYNNKKGILLFCILFLVWAIFEGIRCPCYTKQINVCYRREFYGVQMNHIGLFFILGLFFPDYFILIIMLGALFELLEGWMDHNELVVKKYIGGCFSTRPLDWTKNTSYDSYIFANEKKQLNIVDRVFKINNSTIHMWHGSIAEILANVFGFYIGMLCNNAIYKKN